jgi:hypothetical protein
MTKRAGPTEAREAGRMGIEYHRQLITQMIQRLKRDRRGFGERPCSYHAQEGPAPFITYVLGLQPVQHLLPCQAAGTLHDCLTISFDPAVNRAITETLSLAELLNMDVVRPYLV